MLCGVGGYRLEGEAPAEPLGRINGSFHSRLSRSFALPTGLATTQNLGVLGPRVSVPVTKESFR